MYKVLSRYKESCAVMNTETGEVEAIEDNKVPVLLYFGLEIEGVSLNQEGDIDFAQSIPVMTDEDIEEDLSGFEGDEDDEDIEDYDEDFEDSESGNLDGFDDDYDEEEEEDIGLGEYEEKEEEEEDLGFYDEDDEEEDYSLGDQSTVSKLYAFLTEEQIKILKRYYLWYSQRLFTNAQKDPTLGMKDKNRLRRKQADLNQLRNTGGMWHYAGFVDTGEDGGGYCTLGHRLRYMHLAWDVTQSDIDETFFGDAYTNDFEDLIDSNNCIIFGIKCISDFFEVDSECTKSLQKAQRESLKDMETMYQQYLDGTAQTVSDSFKLMDEVLRKFRIVETKNAMLGNDTLLSHGLLQFYFQFREGGMPLPKSLVQEIRDKIVGWQTHKFYGEIKYPGAGFISNLSRLFGKKFDVFKSKLAFVSNMFWSGNYNDYVYRYLTQYFTYEICGYFKYDANINKDEGGSGSKAREQLHQLYYYTKNRFFKDYEFSLEFIEKLCTLEGLVESFSTWFKGIKTTDLYIDYKRFNTDASGECSIMENIADKVTYSLCQGRTIDEAIKLLESTEDFKKKVLEFEVSSAEDTDESSGVTADEANKYLIENGVHNVSGMDFNKSVLETIRKSGKEPSSRQQFYLSQLYEAETGKKVIQQEKDVYYLRDNADYEKAVDYKINLRGADFVTKVCKSVKKSGHYSSKQRQFLDVALQEYKEHNQ